MKKLLIPLFTLLFVLLISSSAHAAGQLVCLDPGHGGNDTGATYGTLTEAQETWDIANRVAANLSNNGIQYVFTRAINTNPTNSQRAAVCNTAHANLLLSIHLNAASIHTVDYTKVLYGKKNKDTSWAKVVDSSLAQLVAANGVGTIQNNGITNYADGVLLKATMPAALAETVFITSSDEYTLLTDMTGNRQQAIADRLSTAISSWLQTH